MFSPIVFGLSVIVLGVGVYLMSFGLEYTPPDNSRLIDRVKWSCFISFHAFTFCFGSFVMLGAFIGISDLIAVLVLIPLVSCAVIPFLIGIATQPLEGRTYSRSGIILMLVSGVLILVAMIISIGIAQIQ